MMRLDNLEYFRGQWEDSLGYTDPCNFHYNYTYGMCVYVSDVCVYLCACKCVYICVCACVCK